MGSIRVKTFLLDQITTSNIKKYILSIGKELQNEP